MVVWQRPVRVGLAIFVVAFSAIVFMSIRDRSVPVNALVSERDDPEALIESRSVEIMRADESTENLRVSAERQLTYPDGSMRMVDGVKVTVVERPDRSGFVLTGAEARVKADQTEVLLTDRVRLLSNDGFAAEAGEALYNKNNGVVLMPGEAVFTRGSMRASGVGAEYDCNRSRLLLLNDARVGLVGDAITTEIVSQSATLSEADGHMIFEGNVTLKTPNKLMQADMARVKFQEGNFGSQLQALNLLGKANISSDELVAGGLREMTADDIWLGYDKSGQVVQLANLTGGASVEFYGADGETGSRVAGDSIELSLDDVGKDVTALLGSGDVMLGLPFAATDQVVEIYAASVDVKTAPSIGDFFGESLSRAIFDGDVEYRENRLTGDGTPAVRVTRANQLEANLAEGLSKLETARFFGQVRFEGGAITAESEQAVYAVDNGDLELSTIDEVGTVPRLVDQRGSLQADTITVALNGSTIDAVGNVRSILTINGADDSAGITRPSLLVGDRPVYVTAESFAYDRTSRVAIYAGGARLWQGGTEFHGTRIVLDEKRGDIDARGAVRSRTMLRQINEETGNYEESLTIGRGEELHYKEAQHLVLYTEKAQVKGRHGDLTADAVEVLLQSDSKTLERLKANGNVRLEMSKRWMTGASLNYQDADGRYEMLGKPVKIIEEVEGSCRQTTGRALTFFIMADVVSIDGQSEVRTETSAGECPD